MSELSFGERARLTKIAEGTDLRDSVCHDIDKPRKEAIAALREVVRGFDERPRTYDEPGGANDFLPQTIGDLRKEIDRL